MWQCLALCLLLACAQLQGLEHLYWEAAGTLPCAWSSTAPAVQHAPHPQLQAWSPATLVLGQRLLCAGGAADWAECCLL